MIRATYRDKPLVLDILTKSFDTNKSVNYVVRQDKKRDKRIRVLMEYSFESCWEFGEIYLTDNRNGAALILYPHKKRATMHSIIWDVRLALCSIGIERIPRVLKREKYIYSIRPKPLPCLYFWFLGMIPEFQGNGEINKLKDEILAMAEKKNLPVYLETSGEKQKNVYRKYGFELYHTWENSDHKLYFMRKK
jgi:hypothetical protein